LGGRLKSDTLDAERAARQVLAGNAAAQPRLARDTQALRALLTTREGAVIACTAALNELRALIVTSPPELRERLRGLTEARLLNTCVRLRPGRDPERAAIALALRSLARRVRQPRNEAKTLEHELHRRVHALAPNLLDEAGVGTISAAAVLVAWSQPRRVRSEAASARLAGAAPVPASPGKTIRYRLDRGGDRQLNRALHTIILNRRRTDNQTKTYIARRVAEGKTQREATRCLKRYLARSLYRKLETMPRT
jgi:transposase